MTIRPGLPFDWFSIPDINEPMTTHVNVIGKILDLGKTFNSG
jgi:hypothetical protein